jgi:regulator of replication initiation timing
MAKDAPCCQACVDALNKLSEDNRDLHESNHWLQCENVRLEQRLAECQQATGHRRHGPLD